MTLTGVKRIVEVYHFFLTKHYADTIATMSLPGISAIKNLFQFMSGVSDYDD